MTKPLRVIVMIVSIVILLSVTLWYFSPYLLLRFTMLRNPKSVSVRVTQRTLDVQQQMVSAGSYYYKDITFDLPSLNMDIKQLPTTIVFLDPINKQKRIIVSQDKVFSQLANKPQKDAFDLVIESKGIHTGYDYEKYLLEFRPESVSPFNRVDIALAMYLLVLKGVSVTLPPFYSFETPMIKGFQAGDSKEGAISADIFTLNDSEYQMIFQGYSQSEIDQVFNSIRMK